MFSKPDSGIRVAIIGGGLGGAALMRGLLRYPHIRAELYEASSSVSGYTPAFSLGPASQEALRAIDPAIDAIFNQVGAVYSQPEIRVATGPLAGQQVAIEQSVERAKLTVGQRELISGLLHDVPANMIHLNTTLISIAEAPDGGDLILSLDDGRQERYDVVIGSDSIGSKVRSHVIGGNDPALVARPSGFWILCIRIPLQRAQKYMGADAPDPRDPRQTAWVGDGTMMESYLLDGGREVQVTALARLDRSSDEDNSWAMLLTPEEFEQMFGQNSTPACQGMIKMIQSVYTIQIAGICQMVPFFSRTYATHNALLMGDAAHGDLPARGFASTLTVEEALVASTLLGRAGPSPASIAAALRAFDTICRPRAELISRAAFDVGLLVTGRAPGVGLLGQEPEAFAKMLKNKWDHEENFDTRAYLAGAIEVMEKLMARQER
ncbi:hypothetical protein BX600DRAFT_517802 [Xylariales sp. PMI_506]|nr:hypothetical protein BX600DRAFT_517802 [Xylariales sp. PMI_506]